MAERESQGKPPVHDVVCFHCQPCAEKYLKALMEELGLFVPKTHFLDTLLKPLKVHYPMLRGLRRGMLFLSVFAVDSRYPGEDASNRQAQAALRWARKARAEARAILGLRERRRS